jgi:hypothetical protein
MPTHTSDVDVTQLWNIVSGAAGAPAITASAQNLAPGTPGLDTSSAGALVLGAVTATSISLRQATTVTTGGLTVTAGGLTVSASGAAITGNSTVTGTLTSSGALTVQAGGAAVTGNSAVTGTLNVSGLLTAATGLTVTASGLTVSAGGATITGNATVGTGYLLTDSTYGLRGWNTAHTTNYYLCKSDGDYTKFSNPANGWLFNNAADAITWVNFGNTGLCYFYNTVQVAGLTVSTTQLYPATPAGALQTAAGIWGGTGAPNNANGNNGDFYFRSDGGALTTIYQRRTGTWTGII